MIRSANDLLEAGVQAIDGEIGRLIDYYFDDNNWLIRYLSVDVSEWMQAGPVLLSPLAIDISDAAEKRINVQIKKEMIQDSPAIDTERPITRQNEIELHTYYDWPFYWVKLDHSAYPLVEMYTEMREQGDLPAAGELENPHLQSLRQVSRYHIQARDGNIGKVSEFLMDDRSWKIMYLVIDTGTWLPGRKVLISPSWIEEIRWDDSRVRIDLTRETIRNSPEYDPSLPLEREYEERLYRHYDREEYW